MSPELHLRIAGGLMILLAAMHVGFPRYFDWKADLAPLSLINRQMMVIHTFFIGLVVLLVGVLALTSAPMLTSTTLGKRVALGIAVFWGLRLVVQFFGYSSELWRGKGFETGMHILFTFLWCYLTAVFVYTSL